MPILVFVSQKHDKKLLYISGPLVLIARLDYIFVVSFAILFFSVPRRSH